MSQNDENGPESKQGPASPDGRRFLALYMSVVSWGALVVAMVGLVLLRRDPDNAIYLGVVIAGVFVFAGTRIAARRVRSAQTNDDRGRES